MKSKNVIGRWLITTEQKRGITNQAKTLSKTEGQHITESEVVRRMLDMFLTQVKGQK